MKQRPETDEISQQELYEVLEQARSRPLAEEEYRKLKKVLETLARITALLEQGKQGMQRLRQLLFGPRTEKSRLVLPKAAPAAEGAVPGQAAAKTKARGHGRNGAAEYTGAKRERIGHENLKAGDVCPCCDKGKVYGSMEPERLVRLVGQAPVGATLYELQKLRCNLCGEVYTARAPEEVGEEKYDATSAAMIAVLKYGSGMPFHRLEGLQAGLGIPLPATTQWEIVAETASKIRPAFEELARQAAQGDVVYNDDTSAKILSRMKRRADEEATSQEVRRTGMFTSGIASTREGRQIALFFTGPRHAGENLGDLLGKRAAELPPPIQMCDALSRNLPRELRTVVANCLAHSRRKFVEVASNFPEECRYVLDTLGDVYQNDELARSQAMTADERLAFHQDRSEPLMKQLETWLIEQIDEHKVEPNSGLGEAITYMQDHWQALTLFLRVPGAPLDNNLCERILKRAILHRKNALFYKTDRGAQVADLYMSLIHTTELAGGNPFEYLTELQRHTGELAANPAAWMPWNYRETLGKPAASPT